VLWRKFKLEWPYFVGELLIVTLGVLIALALDSWNDARLERRVEDEVLEWLISDMESDTAFFAEWSSNVVEKLAALDYLSAVLADPNSLVEDSLAFLNAIAVGSYYSWNQPAMRRTTFDELVSSGNLGLIDDAIVRRRVVEYYYVEEDSRKRMEGRRTEYPQIAYRLVPRSSEWTAQESLQGARLRLTIDEIRRSDLSEHVVAEINFAGFLQSTIVPLDSLARDLLVELESYREARH
jgi:hypothetical protein